MSDNDITAHRPVCSIPPFDASKKLLFMKSYFKTWKSVGLETLHLSHCEYFIRTSKKIAVDAYRF